MVDLKKKLSALAAKLSIEKKKTPPKLPPRKDKEKGKVLKKAVTTESKAPQNLLEAIRAAKKDKLKKVVTTKPTPEPEKKQTLGGIASTLAKQVEVDDDDNDTNINDDEWED